MTRAPLHSFAQVVVDVRASGVLRAAKCVAVGCFHIEDWRRVFPIYWSWLARGLLPVEGCCDVVLRIRERCGALTAPKMKRQRPTATHLYTHLS